MIAITGVQMAGGSSHQHIADVQWLNTMSGKADRITAGAMIEHIDKGNDVHVGGADGWAKVYVVRPSHGAPYLRSARDKTYTDNLLELPRY
jgi:hypothetical protein